MEEKKSIGVIIFGCAFIILPVCSIFMGNIFKPHSTPLQFFLGGFLAIYDVVTGMGILLLKDWARKLAIIMAIIAIIVALLSFLIISDIIFKNNLYISLGIWLLIYRSFCLYFFTRPKIKAQFKKE